MQNTYHYLTSVVLKLRSITDTVSFTDSTVYSESVGCYNKNQRISGYQFFVFECLPEVEVENK